MAETTLRLDTVLKKNQFHQWRIYDFPGMLFQKMGAQAYYFGHCSKNCLKLKKK